MSSASLPPAQVSSQPQKSRRTRLVVLIVLAALALIVVLLNVGKGAYQGYRLATDAAEHFHWQLDSGDYDGIYRDASSEFRRSATAEQSHGFLQTVHQKMGSSGKTSVTGFHMNWNSGHWWIDQELNTQFALGQARERFIWVMERNRLRLYRCNFDSPNLQ